MNGFEQLENEINKAEAEKELYEKMLNDSKANLKKNRREYRNLRMVKEILQTVGKATQEKLIFEIEKLANLSFDIVFEKKYIVKIEQDYKAGRLTIEFYLIDKKGNKIKPKNNVGVGAIDIFSFSMLISMWILKKDKNKSRTFVLDEPFRNLSKNYQCKTGELLKELSNKLNIQFIVITHKEEIMIKADKVFMIENINGVSYMEER